MFDTLPELIKAYPIGSKIVISGKRDDYTYGKFVVEGYLYENDGKWYPAHRINDTEWETYND